MVDIVVDRTTSGGMNMLGQAVAYCEILEA